MLLLTRLPAFYGFALARTKSSANVPIEGSAAGVLHSVLPFVIIDTLYFSILAFVLVLLAHVQSN